MKSHHEIQYVRSQFRSRGLFAARFAFSVYGARRLRTVADIHHVAILHEVVLPLESKSALGTCVGLGSSFEKLIPVNRLGADEVLLEIRMDRARRLLRSH